MEGQIYAITCIDKHGDTRLVAYTDEKNLKKALHNIRKSNRGCVAHVNKAYMCFDGYLTLGDYLPQYASMEIRQEDI